MNVCKNCGNELKATEKFCTVCGTYFDIEEELGDKPEEEEFDKKKKKKEKKEMKLNMDVELDQEEEPLPEVDIDTEYTSREDPYVEAYIGEDYKWVTQRPFNIYALLLSWMYFLYRKLYLIGIIGLAITGIIIKLFPMIIVPYIVLSMVFSGLFFNKIYLRMVEKKVKKIERNASGLGSFEIESKCKRKGGVNVLLPLFIFFLFLVIMLLNYVKISWNPASPNFWDENSTNQANCKALGKRVYGSLSDYGIDGDLQELACEITTSPTKSYSVYLKLSSGESVKYVLFQTNQDGYFEVKGNTDKITELETLQKEYGLASNYQEFLTTSRELSNKFASLKDDAAYEDQLISQDKDQKEKTHFIFTKDDILS